MLASGWQFFASVDALTPFWGYTPLYMRSGLCVPHFPLIQVFSKSLHPVVAFRRVYLKIAVNPLTSPFSSAPLLLLFFYKYLIKKKKKKRLAPGNVPEKWFTVPFTAA